MPAGVFNFAGQTKVDTFGIDLRAIVEDYDEVMIHNYRISLEAIRKHVDDFSFWQHRQRTGRPPVRERDLMIAFLVRQLFDATFRETEGLLILLANYFELETVPDHSDAFACDDEGQQPLSQALAGLDASGAVEAASGRAGRSQLRQTER
jgi:hypothetical protein